MDQTARQKNCSRLHEVGCKKFLYKKNPAMPALRFRVRLTSTKMKNKCMSKLFSVLTLVVSMLPFIGSAAESKLTVGLEPYGTMSWTGLNGESDLGAGLGATVGITKNLSLTAFAEGDSLDNPNFLDQIARAGAGLRYTAWLGTRVSLDAGVQGAYDIQHENVFLRLPLGANLYAIKKPNYDLGIRLQYAFDISGSGPNGTSTGRAFAGPVFNLRF